MPWKVAQVGSEQVQWPILQTIDQGSTLDCTCHGSSLQQHAASPLHASSQHQPLDFRRFYSGSKLAQTPLRHRADLFLKHTTFPAQRPATIHNTRTLSRITPEATRQTTNLGLRRWCASRCPVRLPRCSMDAPAQCTCVLHQALAIIHHDRLQGHIKWGTEY